MKKSKFSLTAFKDPATAELAAKADHKQLAVWARDCAERVMPYFEDDFPNDPRPRRALAALQDWIDTGAFAMAVIRKASLDSHAAAREVGADTPARSAARAAGQAVATAHVRTHAQGAAVYALQAVYRAAEAVGAGADAAAAVEAEREWQYYRLAAIIDGEK